MLVLAALALGGCGSRAVIVNSTKLELRLDDYRIVPQLVQVRAGRLKIVAYNVGVLVHNVRVEPPNGIPIGGTPIAHPGEVVSGKVTVTPGTYKLVDTISNHADLGDFATLIVR
jgi:hypothetical protein